jgi:sulfur relay (sulfurtransferase) DsrC/TusE family protein
MVDEIAGDQGIHEVTDRHWEVVKFMRHEYEE